MPTTLNNIPQTSSAINLLPNKRSCATIYKTSVKEINLNVIGGTGVKGATYIEPFISLNVEDYNSEYSYWYDKSKTINGI